MIMIITNASAMEIQGAWKSAVSSYYFVTSMLRGPCMHPDRHLSQISEKSFYFSESITAG